MNRRSIIIFICGVITLSATIMISMTCIDDWSGLTGWAFSAMLWSEIFFFGGLVFAEWAAGKGEQIMIRAALYVLLSGYVTVNIPVSVLFIAFFKKATTAFTVIEVILFAVVFIAVVVTLAAGRSVRQSNELQSAKAGRV